VQYEPQLSEALGRLGTLREEFKASIDADAASYNAVMKAYQAAKGSSEGPALINAALREAANVPLGVAERAAEVAKIAESLRPMTSPMMSSDLTTAMALAGAATTGALANVQVNLESMDAPSAEDAALIVDMRERADRLAGRN
jgi:glutamate formiminotransferase/formiminotetrahydrofolate cyclodeaminase